jgi:tight adherence protein B
MGIAFVVFVFVVGLIMATYAGIAHLPGYLAQRELDKRLRDVSAIRIDDTAVDPAHTVVRQEKRGPLPALDRALAHSPVGGKLQRMLQQSGVKSTPSAIIVVSLVSGAVGFVVGGIAAHQFTAQLVGAGLGLVLPFVWLRYKASRRLKRFEEQFPEALDLLSRAIRAGHAFQTAMGMVADELPEPVGPEFKTTFDQQNFGLPLKDALNELADRIGLLDVRFFVTAVLIQRDTGGNLAEILDNLAHVVRERFKILRQVRVHTAHGRFTGYVLLALPAFLACALMIINPEHMSLLFTERMGQLMVMGAIVMQTVGFFWIRQVIKIEV